MIDEGMAGAINDQINAELYSAYIYYSMGAWFEEQNLPGMAQWMKAQTQEEMFHADKFFNYLAERGGRVLMQAIDEPPTEWDSPLAVFEHAYEHEQYVTSRINDLVDLAVELKDHATNQFLQWYVEEQVEEEASADEIVQQLKRIGDSANALYMLDKELSARTFSLPAEGEEEE
ncbi:MAG: ferritin [Armatimonadota bacterium]|nr:ferritin [Armatimonadota bacterium]